MFHRIVVGYDGSDGARVALEEASTIARRDGATVDVVHVVHMPALAEEAVRDTSRILEEASVAGRELLRTATEALHASGVEARAHLANGLVWDQVLRQAADVNADLIVVGVRHHNALRLKIVRCTAGQIVDRAHCTVLVARRADWAGAHADDPHA